MNEFTDTGQIELIDEFFDKCEVPRDPEFNPHDEMDSFTTFGRLMWFNDNFKDLGMVVPVDKETRRLAQIGLYHFYERSPDWCDDIGGDLQAALTGMVKFLASMGQTLEIANAGDLPDRSQLFKTRQ